MQENSDEPLIAKAVNLKAQEDFVASVAQSTRERPRFSREGDVHERFYCNKAA